MKKLLFTMIIALSMLAFVSTSAQASTAVSLAVNKKTTDVHAVLINSTTYVPLRAVTNLLNPEAAISWENRQAFIRTPELTALASPGKNYMDANGRMLYIKDGVKLINGSTMVPIRTLAKAFGAEVDWNGNTKTANVTFGSGTITTGDKYYDSDSVYWLSRIISAESKGEPLEGKIAVGNVVLNRVESPDYPSTIYDVIFDRKWGVQFQPTANGAIYKNPDAESILAAKLCLDGASIVGDSLFFLNPDKSTNFWAINNCSFHKTIGNHLFYA